MREVIRNIFEEMGFLIDEELLNIDDAFYTERTSDNKFDFFVVLFQKAEELNVEVNNITYFLNLIIENKQNYMGLDKNLTLLMLLECDSIEQQENVNSMIFDIEEDPYDFKKYVLPYTTGEVSELKKNVINSGLSTVRYIEQKVFDVQLFSDFKRRVNSLSVKEYELITKFFIKLPFLNLDIRTQDFLDLSKLIQDEIQAEDKDVWNQLLNLYQQTDESTDLSAEEILNFMEADKLE
ncbi:hypothetical protein RE628_04435 [Paenibacillus sp. D2_2]|uniref:ABC-three component system middle component 1 n=1 Tax=Paenibacillus sp. D2_2 TaxID=3073092 RepID=UPI0028167429|nr:ABC-three component system middle component 1 [Paenibacillus sp. D2_2]WMT41743.1 hypothetical protein RE628_04435 [Paenibacillus sp. D2_2]